MIKAENYNEIQRARRDIHNLEEKMVQARLDLADACKNAIKEGATLRDVGQILGMSREGARKIALKARFENNGNWIKGRDKTPAPNPSAQYGE